MSSQLQCVPGTTSVIGVLDAFGLPAVGFDVAPGARVVRTALGEGEGEGDDDGDGAGGGVVVSLGPAPGVALATGAAEAACGAGSGCGPAPGTAAHTAPPTAAAATAATIPARRPLPHVLTVPPHARHSSSVHGA
ncbi:hypothetical protein Kpho02_29460 [Kitasatospora phosalacinea]|uniref:Uncharacterized protein n=1 Tax=Kitasatospora phosalacinea TaxID=2065 RepID=A0A9W6Q9R8_9ACTN|nr:hypothetical protein [Kitasatospora phosalacinea]GLW70647.1 hypothetical protein Kpho02_29460 [Kitasatospora phosalacinea]